MSEYCPIKAFWQAVCGNEKPVLLVHAGIYDTAKFVCMFKLVCVF